VITFEDWAVGGTLDKTGCVFTLQVKSYHSREAALEKSKASQEQSNFRQMNPFH